eukprot:scaffold6018_cov109-Ochromonas_danica.AAC.1
MNPVDEKDVIYLIDENMVLIARYSFIIEAAVTNGQYSAVLLAGLLDYWTTGVVPGHRLHHMPGMAHEVDRGGEGGRRGSDRRRRSLNGEGIVAQNCSSPTGVL